MSPLLDFPPPVQTLPEAGVVRALPFEGMASEHCFHDVMAKNSDWCPQYFFPMRSEGFLELGVWVPDLVVFDLFSAACPRASASVRGRVR